MINSHTTEYVAKLCLLLEGETPGELELLMNPWHTGSVHGSELHCLQKAFFTIIIRKKARAVSLWKRLTYQWRKRQQSKTSVIKLRGKQSHKSLVLAGLKFNKLFNGYGPSSPGTRVRERAPQQRTIPYLQKSTKKYKTNIAIVSLKS